MKTEFIYTIGETHKIVIDPSIVSILQDKEALVKLALTHLSEKEKLQLINISIYVYFEGEYEIILPEWFSETKGKFRFGNGISIWHPLSE